MADEQGTIERDPEIVKALGGITIDPATWQEPKETFPGEIVESTYRLAPPEYRAATEFRPAIEENIPQWDLRVKRLDAIGVRPDGEQVELIRYGGIDLKKWSNAEKAVVPVSSRFPKEHNIIAEWKRVFGTLEPPERLRGVKAMFDYYETKSYGRVLAKRVLLPVAILTPDYKLAGEVRIINLKAREEEAQGGGETVAVPLDSLSETDALTVLASQYLPGKNVNNTGELVNGLPQNLRLGAIVAGLATGKLIQSFKEQGLITVDEAGLIAAA